MFTVPMRAAGQKPHHLAGEAFVEELRWGHLAKLNRWSLLRSGDKGALDLPESHQNWVQSQPFRSLGQQAGLLKIRPAGGTLCTAWLLVGHCREIQNCHALIPASGSAAFEDGLLAA